ncbi:MAG: hypothetical protein ACI9IP_000480 [Arcticibacterium sp.]|jgi:hypothetical protein
MVIFSSILFCLFLFFLHRGSLLLAEGLHSYFILLFLGLVSVTIPSGYVLSSFGEIGNPMAWSILLCIFSGLILAILVFLGSKANTSLKGLITLALRKLKRLWAESSTVQKGIFSVLSVGLLICSFINVLVLFMTYPNEWDSMTGHLVKCAYYIQNGNMDRLGGTSWSIDFYPNSLPTLQILGYHVFGEKGFKVIHFLAYWIFVLTTFGITKSAFSNVRGALFVGLIAALLPSALIQAVTTETDIVQSAYLGLVIYFLMKVYRHASWLNIILFVFSSAVWVSHKVTFLLIGPAVAVLVLFMFFQRSTIRKRALPTVLGLALGLCIYVLPNGYIANVKEVGKFSLGALSAPEEVMKWHGIENYSSAEKLKNFQLNVLRYSSDFLQLDGIRNTETGSKVNEAFRFLPNKIFEKFALERLQFWVVYPFEMMGSKQMHFYKERPFWGIISFMLVLPVIVLLLFFWRKREGASLALIFMLAGLLHFLSLCFSAPYDPIKGRYFMNMAVWFLPLLAWFFKENKGMKYILACSFVIAISAIFTLSHRSLYPLFGENSIFRIDRLSQVMLTRPETKSAYERFDELVPEDAVVALGTQQEHEDYIYPLWGKDFKRTLIPIHPFRSAVKPIPKEAEFLFYSEGVIPFEDGDIQLNKGDILKDSPVEDSKFYLREL